MEINECEPIETDEPRDIFLGQVVNSKEEAYDLYQEHAFKVGFSVRKGKECYYDNEKKNTRLKEFYCSKQGFKNNEPDGEVAYKRADSRTNCKAMMLKKWRRLEVEEEFKNSQSTPPLVINISETLRHASTVYTHKVFNLFLNEYLEGTGGSTSIEIGQSDNVSNHEVMLNNKPNKKYTVTFDSSDMKINCSCCKFDSLGILCSHALRIYNIKGILRIPDQYFLKRWSKNARSVIYDHITRAMGEDSTSNSGINDGDAGILYRNAIMKSFYYLVLESQDSKEAQNIMWKLLDIGVERVRKGVGKGNLTSYEETTETNFNENEESCFTPMV
ncbi:non-specific serine/threonine protein kinase [Trifolium repens]|nr:non-specific serine/threonine protein kinase [Trifolium repens]